MSEVTAEREGNRIIVQWGSCSREEFNDKLTAMRQIPGRRWLRERSGRPWSVPLDMTVCRLLRKGYGDTLRIGSELRSWAYEARRAEERLGSISAATSGTLVRLPNQLPMLYRALYLGPLGKTAKDQLGYTDDEIDAIVKLVAALTHTTPWNSTMGSYQTADVRFLSDSPAPGNFNHQGLGKTLEAIAEVWESRRQCGNHLVICPKGAIETVWKPELEHWQADSINHKIGVYACLGTKAQRTTALMEFTLSTADVRWVVVNPEMVRFEKDDTNESPIAFRAKPKEWADACDCNRLVDPHWHYRTRFPVLGNTEWNTIINDEVHKGNIRNHRSLTSKSVESLCRAHDGKAVAMSGTPMKKKGADIWGIFHYLRPEVFTSFWRFAEMFFEIEENEYGKTIGDLREDMEQEFYRYLTPYALRRTKAECSPWLPAKQHVDVWVTLEGKQAKQYAEMEKTGCAALGKASISTAGTLAQFVRLQQFAGAYCEVIDGEVRPTRFSAKLDALWERLGEAGILDGSSEDQTVVFSQSRKTVELVHEMLTERGVVSEIVSGVTVNKRAATVKRFQSGETKVLCIVTTAGGVALTLDSADIAHFLDESWAPDDQEQAEDRLHRVSRVHQVVIYHYRARNTIDEDKMQTADEKRKQHERIMDVRRRVLERHGK